MRRSFNPYSVGFCISLRQNKYHLFDMPTYIKKKQPFQKKVQNIQQKTACLIKKLLGEY